MRNRKGWGKGDGREREGAIYIVSKFEVRD